MLHGWDLGQVLEAPFLHTAPGLLSAGPKVTSVGAISLVWLGEGAPPEGAAVTKEGELLIPPCENTLHTPSQVCHRTHCRGGGGALL